MGLVLSKLSGAKGYLNYGTSEYDADAKTYFSLNTAILNIADKNVINDFYLGLKSDGIYTKIRAMHFPIWLTAANCKWNMINNRTYDLSFTTGWTFSSGGITGNGTSTYANSFYSGNANVDAHLAVYSRTQTVGSLRCEVGAYDTTGGGIIFGLYTANVFYSDDSLVPVTFTTTTDARGFWTGVRRSNTDREVYRNGISQRTVTAASSRITLPVSPNYIGARNSYLGTDGYSSKQIAFVSQGLGLTDTEVANFSTRVNTLMTYFGINVY